MEALSLVCLYGLTSYEDLKTRQVRVIEVLIFGVFGIFFNLICKPHTAISVLGGVLVGAGVYIFSIFSKEKIGKGDGLIVMVTGLYLGFRSTLYLLWISSVLAAMVGTVFIKRHGEKMDFELPFVPFLMAGYLIQFILKGLGGFVVCG